MAEIIKEATTSRGRKETRIYEKHRVIKNKISDEWQGIRYIIKVIRRRKLKNKESEEVSYYITNKNASLEEISEGIRNHWTIENSLHWVKDVVFKEDRTRHKSNAIAKIKSIVINIALNLIRKYENKHITKSIRLNCNNIEKLLYHLE